MMTRKPLVSILIPTYNEAESIRSVLANLGGYCFTVLVDDSTDGTDRIAGAMGAIVLRGEGGKRLGFGGSLRRGLYHISGVVCDYVVVMDAGGAHDPDAIPRLVAKAEEGYDLVIASRFHGKFTWQSWRTLLSLTATRLARWVWGVPVTDATTGFRCYRVTSLRPALRGSKAAGFAVQLELLRNLHRSGGRIAEIGGVDYVLTASQLRSWMVWEAVCTLFRR